MRTSIIFILVALIQNCFSCTNFIITKGASAENNTIITYADDSVSKYGYLDYQEAADHPEGAMRDIYNWENGEYLGQIPEVSHTYRTIGNINEWGLSIGETTYGGLKELISQTGAILDYGSLIYIALQRAKNASEAITVITSLVEQYGYYSEGETFTIADPNEVWLMDFIGKGNYEKGAVWVARRIPDGYISAHANQCRINELKTDDPENWRYAKDVVTFAQAHGFYNGSADNFSFTETYSPINFDLARACEARVWSFFRKVNPDMDQYLDYAMGTNLTHRIPLYIKPNRTISINDTMFFMKDHYENTELDFRYDVGAESAEKPYRWRPLDWTYNNSKYFNERSVGTQQTAWSMVSQLGRPNKVGSTQHLFWFGVDDTTFTIYTPIYSNITHVPSKWSNETASIMQFSLDSAFWVFNLIANYAYMRYSVVHPEITQKIIEYQNAYLAEVETIDEKYAALYSIDPEGALNLLTTYSLVTADNLVSNWLEFWKYLFTKYLDGNIRVPNPPHKFPKVTHPGYPEEWYDRVVKETGDHYKITSSQRVNFDVHNPPLKYRKLY